MFLRKWYFLISLIVILLSYKQITTIFPINLIKKEITSTHKSLVIVSYNMNANIQKHLPDKPNAVIEYLLSTNADIICVQEYYVKSDKAFLTQKDVDSIFKSYPYKYIKFDFEHYDGITGLATFSKYPIINNKRIQYESIFNASMYSDIVVNKDTIRVFNNHLESNRFTGNDLLLARQLKYDFSTDLLTQTTKDFSQKLEIAFPVRAKQADKISDVIKSTPYKIILCGDFNDVPISYTYTKIKNDLIDAFVECGTGFGWTFNSSIYKVRVDYIFHDHNFEAEDFQIGKSKGSDHFPVKCTLKLK